jgi:hypothetical protein
MPRRMLHARLLLEILDHAYRQNALNKRWRTAGIPGNLGKVISKT